MWTRATNSRRLALATAGGVDGGGANRLIYIGREFWTTTGKGGGVARPRGLERGREIRMVGTKTGITRPWDGRGWGGGKINVTNKIPSHAVCSYDMVSSSLSLGCRRSANGTRVFGPAVVYHVVIVVGTFIYRANVTWGTLNGPWNAEPERICGRKTTGPSARFTGRTTRITSEFAKRWPTAAGPSVGAFRYRRGRRPLAVTGATA